MSNIKCCPPESNCNLPVGCINPLVHLMKRTVARASDGYDIPDAFNDILGAGILISGSDAYCCPDCTDEKGFYFLGGVPAFIDITSEFKMNLYNADGSPVDPLLIYPCCIKSTYSLEGSLQMDDNFIIRNSQNEIVLDKTPQCCPTDFTKPINRLLEETASDSYVNYTGWIEASSFNGKSGIDIILDFLNSLSPSVTKAEKTEIFKTIALSGIYIKCNGCDMQISKASPWDYFYNRS